MSPKTLLLVLFLTGLETARAVVTNEDIRVAILQIVNVVRSTDDKLERHEYRDRVVGEQLKKGMVNIDKRIKMLDPLKGTVGRLDERLAAVETILMQKNEREKMQLQRTYEAVIDIQKNLPVIIEEMKNEIIGKLSTHEPPAQIIEPVISKKDFEKLEKEVVGKMDKVTNSISKIESELTKIKDDGKHLKDLNNKSTDSLEKLKKNINDNQQLLTKYDKKLTEYNNKIPTIASTHSKDQDELKQSIIKALDGHKSTVKEILLDIKNIQNKITQLPQKDDLNISQKTTLKKLDDLSKNISTVNGKQQTKLSDDIRRAIDEMVGNINITHDETMKNINGLSEISSILMKSLANTNTALDGQKGDVKILVKNVKDLQDKIQQLPQKDDLSVVQHTTLKKLGELNTGSNDPTKGMKEVLTDMKTLQNQIAQLPQKRDLVISQNTTLNQLASSTNEIKKSVDNLNVNLTKNHEDTVRNLNDLSEITGNLGENFATNYGKIKNEIQALSKLDQIMIKTGDDVVDTKRRVEYGVHQILGELSKQFKESTKHINQGLSDRFDIFEASILDEETGALANITSKLGEDIHQVWRQIGIMYQQISNSADTLDKLQNMTDTYVNGSLGAMDNMRGKVSQINGRMTEVDENLNYLLGRLSLVTQEFNRIKTGLSAALDQIRDSFHDVQSKLPKTGPGPYQIPNVS